MGEATVDRRTWLKILGGTIVGLVVGGVAGYLARPTEKIEVTRTVTSTMTKTVTVTPTPVTTPATSTTPAPALPETIKIGVITPLSPPGDYVSGKLILQTAELFRDWINAQGGILGKSVELVVADQTLDPSVAIGHLSRMVTKDKVVAIIGVWESLVAVPVARASKDYPCLQFYFYSWADEITAEHYKYVFRVGVFNSLFAMHSMEFFDWAGWKNLAVIVEESPYGFGQRDAMKKLGEEKYPDVKMTFIPAAMGKADYTPELTKVKALSPTPDALVIHMNVPHAFVVARQAVELGLKDAGINIFFGNDCPTWDPKSFWESVGEGGVGMYFPTYYSPYMKLSPVGEEFWKLFREKYGKDPYFALGWEWDCLRILAKAIEETKSVDPDVLAGHIEKMKIQGTTGWIKFENDPTPGSVLWHQWIGMKQFVFKFTEYKQDPMKAEQVYPPLT